MFSKLAASGVAPPDRWRRPGDGAASPAASPRGVATEVFARLAAAIPGATGGSCVYRAGASGMPRSSSSSGVSSSSAGGGAATIRTTVRRRPRACRIRTTVSEWRSRRCASGAAAADDRLALRRQDDDWRSEAARALLGAVAPLQLLSPWVPGVALAMMPGVPPPPPFVGHMKLPAMPPEEEEFAALIFPGFESGAFIWQVTCWQIAEFVFSMCLGHDRANPTPCVLYRLGASWGPAITRGGVWRLVAPVMLHANLTHLLFNVFFQLRMGFGMEKQFGRNKMMMLYFACGLFGNLMSVTLDPFKLAVGASTAGFGLIGVWLAEILLSWEVLGPARERTIIWIVFMLISVTTMSSMTPNMDLYGHLGGALGGFLLSIVISDMREEDRPAWYGQARAASALALAALLAGGLGKVFFLSPGDPLPNCPLLGSASAAAVASALAASAPRG